MAHAQTTAKPALVRMRAVIASMMFARHALVTVIARVTRARDTHAQALTHHAGYGQHAATVMLMMTLTARSTGEAGSTETGIVSATQPGAIIRPCI